MGAHVQRHRAAWVTGVLLAAGGGVVAALAIAGVFARHPEAFAQAAPTSTATATTTPVPTATPVLPTPTPAGGSISGTVTNKLGTPVAGASIQANQDGCCGWGYATTGPDGSYVATDLAPGYYRVQVSAAGYASQYYDNVYDWGSATLVPVAMGSQTGGIDFALGVGGSISGTIKDESGTPLAGGSVSAWTTGCCSWGNGGSGLTGYYRVPNLAPGTYIVQASRSGFAPEYYNGTYDASTATLVTVTDGVETTGINFVLAPGAAISGLITDASGTPVPGANVSANPATCCGLGGYATSWSDGTFLLGDLPAGVYKVAASATGFSTQYYNDKSQWDDADPVPVTKGNEVGGVNFTLQPPGSIGGKVSDNNGTPIAGAWVTANGLEGCCNWGAYTDAFGDYIIGDLSPGDFIVRATAPGFAGEYYSNTYDWPAATPVPVQVATQTTGINFTLVPGFPPSNDFIANAAMMSNTSPPGGSSLPYGDTRDTTFAGLERAEPQPCAGIGGTVWYRYEAMADGWVQADTFGSSFDTALAAYVEGPSPPGTLGPIPAAAGLPGCNDDAVGAQSRLVVPVLAGQAYFFQAGGKNSARGTLQFHAAVPTDTDGDGYPDLAEIALGKNPVVSCAIMRADVRGDGVVNLLDLARVAQQYSLTIPPGNPRYDQNGDSKINLLDLAQQAIVFAEPITTCP